MSMHPDPRKPHPHHSTNPSHPHPHHPHHHDEKKEHEGVTIKHDKDGLTIIINITNNNNLANADSNAGVTQEAETGGQISGKHGENANQGGQIAKKGGKNANQDSEVDGDDGFPGGEV